MSKAILYATPLLVQKRNEKNMSQKEFADWLTLELGRPVSASIVQKWEQRRERISSELALEIARVIKVQVLDLVKRQDGEVEK